MHKRSNISANTLPETLYKFRHASFFFLCRLESYLFFPLFFSNLSLSPPSSSFSVSPAVASWYDSSFSSAPVCPCFPLPELLLVSVLGVSGGLAPCRWVSEGFLFWSNSLSVNTMKTDLREIRWCTYRMKIFSRTFRPQETDWKHYCMNICLHKEKSHELKGWTGWTQGAMLIVFPQTLHVDTLQY